MDLLTLGIAVFVFGPPALFLAMAIRHFIPMWRGMKYPWWAAALGPWVYFNSSYFSPEAIKHRRPCAYYTIAFVGWILALFLFFELMEIVLPSA